MKRLFIIAAFVVATVSANAQLDKGTFSLQPKIGIGSGFITNMPDLREDLSDLGIPQVNIIDLARSVLPAFTVGLEAEYQITDKVGLAASLNYNLQGGSWRSYHTPILNIKSPSIILGYLNLPAVANVYVYEGLAIKAGVQFGFLTNANNKMTVDYTPQAQVGQPLPTTTTYNHKESILDECRRFQFAIPVGISYELDNHCVLDLRYHIDLTRINKDDEATGNLRNSTFLLTLGYKFDLDD